MLRRLQRKAKSFTGLIAFVKVWLLPAWVLLGLSRLAVLVVPMRYIGRFMGVSCELDTAPPEIDERQEHRAREIGRVVRIAAGYAPWNANCFAQALTARVLMGLYRAPYAIFFGVMRDPETREMKAHAWVAAGSVKITGGDGFAQFAVVAAYLPARR